MSYNSIAGGAPGGSASQSEGLSFQLVVEAKAKTEKVKSTGGTASYYPVAIPKKSYKAPAQKFPMPGGTAIRTVSLDKDAKGKLYVSGGDVDVSNVMGKKLTTKIGDGTADPAGSMIITLVSTNTVTMESTGKAFMVTKSTNNYTTGKSYTVVKGSKSRLEGKALPNDDSTNSLPTPLVGKPLDLEAGTGTLVSTGAIMNIKNKTLGMLDILNGGTMVLKITKQ